MPRHLVFLTLLTLTLLPFCVAAQKSDTVYYRDSNKKIQSIVTKIDKNKGRIRYWHLNGILAGDVCFDPNYYIPTCDAVLYAFDGSVYQKYIEATKTLNTYERGHLVNQTVCHPDSINRETSYYYSSRKKDEIIEMKGKNPRPFHISWGGNNKYGINIRHDERIAYKIMSEYYPDGTLLHRYEYSPGNGKDIKDLHKKTYYHPDGTIDPLTQDEQYKKRGTFRSFYNNGNPKYINRYEASNLIGCQMAWTEAGDIWYHSYHDRKKEIRSGPCIERMVNGSLTTGLSDSIGFRIQWDPVNKKEFEQYYLPELGNRCFVVPGKGTHSLGDSGLPVTGKKSQERFYANGKLAYRAKFKSGLLDGPFIIYDTTGYKLLECVYKQGKLNGPFTVYHPFAKRWDGKRFPPNAIKASGSYRDNQLDGHYVSYFDDSAKQSEGTYDTGKRVDTWDRYYYELPHKLVSREIWINGKQTGDATYYYHVTGALIKEVKNKPGNRVEEITYHDHGTLANRYLKNSNTGAYDTIYDYSWEGVLNKRSINTDPKTGIRYETYYYPSGRKRSEWGGNDSGGVLTTWHKNGQMQSTGQTKPRKDGEWMYYDSLGNPEKRYFRQGVEIITAPPDDPCFCNEYSWLDYKDMTRPLNQIEGINTMSRRFTLSKIDEEHHVNYSEGAILAYSDIKIHVDGPGGIAINLLPCRHGENMLRSYVMYQDNAPEEQEHLYFINADISTEEWFTRLARYKANELYLLRATKNLTRDTAAINTFLSKNFGFSIRQSQWQQNEENITNTLRNQLSNSQVSDAEKEPFDKFTHRYYEHFIKPALASQSVDTVFYSVFFCYAYESDDTDRFYDYNMPEDNVYSFKAFKDRYQLKAQVRMNPTQIEVELPARLLKAAKSGPDVKPERRRAKVSIPTATIMYENYPHESIDVKKRGKACMDPWEITGTGITLIATDAEVDFNAGSNTNLYKTSALAFFPAHETYSLSPKTGYEKVCDPGKNCLYIKRDNYLKSFMGISVSNGALTIPAGNGKYWDATVSNLIIDGTEMNGTLSLPKAKLSSVYSQSFIEQYLKRLGLTISQGPAGLNTNPDAMIIYFHYKGIEQ